MWWRPGRVDVGLHGFVAVLDVIQDLFGDRRVFDTAVSNG